MQFDGSLVLSFKVADSSFESCFTIIIAGVSTLMLSWCQGGPASGQLSAVVRDPKNFAEGEFLVADWDKTFLQRIVILLGTGKKMIMFFS